MYEKVITFVDYNDEERTEKFYFNFSRAETLEYELGVNGGLSKQLELVVATRDQPKIIAFFKDFVLKAYGEKSDDGRRFVKTPEITLGFSQTEAYSNLFLELSTNAESAAAFVNGVIPKTLEDHLPPAKKGPKNLDTPTQAD